LKSVKNAKMKALLASTSMNMIEEFINPDGWARQQKILSGRILPIAEYPRSEYKTVDSGSAQRLH
jgi:hypothetical protein